MNRFRFVSGKKNVFEGISKKRDSRLGNTAGFESFKLVKGKKESDFTLYASHSRWTSEAAILNSTKSNAFRLAHGGGGEHSDRYMKLIVFEGFEVTV